MNHILAPESKGKRALHLVMRDINNMLIVVHKKISRFIDLEQYETLSGYVSQYVSYTTIWNIKFTYNLESPEVALMQIMHLEYIFNNEQEQLFQEHRKTLQEMKQLFLSYSPYSNELIEKRKEQLQQYMAQHY